MSFDPRPELVLKNQYGEPSINYVQKTALLSASVTLTAAQVIALNATPQVLVPAVTGKIIKVSSVVLNYIFGSAAFTIGSTKHLLTQYQTSSITIASQNETGLIDQGSSKEGIVFGAGAGGTGIRGQAVQLTSDDTTIAAGTGSTLNVVVYYELI